VGPALQVEKGRMEGAVRMHPPESQDVIMTVRTERTGALVNQVELVEMLELVATGERLSYTTSEGLRFPTPHIPSLQTLVARVVRGQAVQVGREERAEKEVAAEGFVTAEAQVAADRAAQVALRGTP
jgi:hypothetical protein